MHADMLFIALSALQIADASLTIQAIRDGAKEANPIMAWFIEQLGIEAGTILPKVAVMVAIWIAALPWWALACLVGWYGYWAVRGFRASA